MDGWHDAAVFAVGFLSLIAVLISLLVLSKIGGLFQTVAGQAVSARLAGLDEGQARLERMVREDLRIGREESAASGAQLRQEVVASMKALLDSVIQQAADVGRQQKEQLETFSAQLRRSVAETAQHMKENHEALTTGVKDIRE